MRLRLLSGIVGICLLPALAGASEKADQKNQMVGMPNPASKLCGELGGESKIYSLRSGGQTGLCKFSDAEHLAGLVEEWTLAKNYARQNTMAVKAFFEHVEYNQPAQGMVGHPARQYCLQLGGEQQIIHDALGESGICKFQDGSGIEEWTLFRGPEVHANLAEALNTFNP